MQTITKNGIRTWVKGYKDQYAKFARTQGFDLHFRLHYLALSNATPDNHVHFEAGEIRRTLEVANRLTGEIGPAGANKVSQAIARAVELELLAPGSNARCLILPTGFQFDWGTPGKPCDRHTPSPRRGNSEPRPGRVTSPRRGNFQPNLPLGGEVTSPGRGNPDAVTCEDASTLLDVLMEGVEVESSGVKDQEVPSGTSSQLSTGEEMSALSGTHRQKVKKISEISGLEEILFTGEEDEGLTAQSGEESTGEENKGLSAQSGLLLVDDDWGDPLPSSSAGEEAPEGASPEPSGEEAKPESSAAVEPPRLHCSGCDESGHSYWACPRVDTAGAEAVEVDEAQEEPIGRMIGSMHGGGRRLATPTPAAAEPPRYRPSWGRSS